MGTWRLGAAVLLTALVAVACVPTDSQGGTGSTTSTIVATSTSTSSSVPADPLQHCLADRQAIIDGWNDYQVARAADPTVVLGDFVTLTSSAYFQSPFAESGVLRIVVGNQVTVAQCPHITSVELGMVLACLTIRQQTIDAYPAWLAALAANPSAQYSNYLPVYPRFFTLPGSAASGVVRDPSGYVYATLAKCPDIRPSELLGPV